MAAVARLTTLRACLCRGGRRGATLRLRTAQRRWKAGDDDGFKFNLKAAWQRVNPANAPIGGIFGGRDNTGADSPFGKEDRDKNLRGPLGTASEPAFPAYKSYPRVAGLSEEQRQRARDETAAANQYGSYALVFLGCALGGLGLLTIDIWFLRPERYYIPQPSYLTHHEGLLDIDHVVWLEMAVNGKRVGRIDIGLFHKACPIFCENFHRLITGDNEKGETFKGSLFWKSTGINLYGGDFRGVDGQSGKVVIPEFAEDGFLPEEPHNSHSWPFACIASGAILHNEWNFNTSNFMIALKDGRPVTDGSFSCFGMVLKGYDVIESLSKFPREPFPYFIDRIEVVDCGVSDLSFDHAQIAKLQKRYHAARVRHFLATEDYHKEKYDRQLQEEERKGRLRDKRSQVAQELQEARAAEVKG
eukprot:TRINITY_DN7437_c0_g1_i1.p2 TRINITY_DN7437_c0_g1~~TRINITY_DN7437_c0_g1_i1.p2  ORF type:complete len:416 (+),score=80.61 TRINITY_DN7437_c0_g1_i1:410-1657(+)